jgi:apolipoprotein N-acyltransferase
VKVAGVQMETVSLTEFLKETRALPDDIQYAVWPEYAVPYDIRMNLRDWKLVEALCQEKNLTLTFGTQLDHSPRPGWSNISLTMDPDGTRGEHKKVHTVHFFDDGTPGKTALPVATRHGMVGTPICFDCDYEGITRRMTKAGAEMFVVPVMDAVSWTARQHDQHAELFRIRACENARWMFVCASSGVSQIIDPQGQLHARLGALEQGVMSGWIRPESELTFYTRIGYLLPWGGLVLAAGIWFLLMLPAGWVPEWIFRVKGLGDGTP